MVDHGVYLFLSLSMYWKTEVRRSRGGKGGGGEGIRMTTAGDGTPGFEV